MQDGSLRLSAPWLLAKAACFRNEAKFLAERATRTGEPSLSDAYKELSERWLAFAADLELLALSTLSEKRNESPELAAKRLQRSCLC